MIIEFKEQENQRNSNSSSLEQLLSEKQQKVVEFQYELDSRSHKIQQLQCELHKIQTHWNMASNNNEDYQRDIDRLQLELFSITSQKEAIEQ